MPGPPLLIKDGIRYNGNPHITTRERFLYINVRISRPVLRVVTNADIEYPIRRVATPSTTRGRHRNMPADRVLAADCV